MRTQTDTQKPRNNNKKHHAFVPVPVAITHSLSPTPVRSHAYARTTNDLGHTQTHTPSLTRLTMINTSRGGFEVPKHLCAYPAEQAQLRMGTGHVTVDEFLGSLRAPWDV